MQLEVGHLSLLGWWVRGLSRCIRLCCSGRKDFVKPEVSACGPANNTRVGVVAPSGEGEPVLQRVVRLLQAKHASGEDTNDCT